MISFKKSSINEILNKILTKSQKKKYLSENINTTRNRINF